MKQVGYVQSILKKLREGKSSGVQSTYRALVRKGNKAHLPAYYKVFDAQEYELANFNELLGYEIAKHNGLPVPPDTFICACKPSMLISPSSDVAERFKDTQYISGIASIDSNPHHFTQLNYSNPKFANDLLNWRHIAKAAVFDELVVNIDRNNGNLIRVREHEYVLIDHHQILEGGQWNIDKLPEILQAPSMKNDLASFIAASTDEVLKRRMIKIANEGINIPVISDMPCLQHYERLCGWDIGAVERILELLEVRVMRLPEFIHFHLSTGQLFDGAFVS